MSTETWLRTEYDDCIVVKRADVPEIVGTTMSGDAEWYVFADGRVRGILTGDEHYDRAVAYLAAHEYQATHPPVPPVSDEDVETVVQAIIHRLPGSDPVAMVPADQTRAVIRAALATGKVTVTA